VQQPHPARSQAQTGPSACVRTCSYPRVDCGEADPIVLEFDYAERPAKPQAVGIFAGRGYLWTTVDVRSRSVMSAAPPPRPSDRR
jgi:hypothetical protein